MKLLVLSLGVPLGDVQSNQSSVLGSSPSASLSFPIRNAVLINSTLNNICMYK